jgi:hypothetical protein
VVAGGVIFMICSSNEFDAARPLSVILKPIYSTTLSANVHFVGFNLSPANLRRVISKGGPLN